jgi:hypothetical protein
VFTESPPPFGEREDRAGTETPEEVEEEVEEADIPTTSK